VTDLKENQGTEAALQPRRKWGQGAMHFLKMIILNVSTIN